MILRRPRALEVSIGDLLCEDVSRHLSLITFQTISICIYKHKIMPFCNNVIWSGQLVCVCFYVTSHLVLFVELSWFWRWLDLWAVLCSVSAPPGWCPWWTALLWRYPADSTWTQKPTLVFSLASPEHTDIIRGSAACCTPSSHLSLKNLCMPKATSLRRASMTKMNVKT